MGFISFKQSKELINFTPRFSLCYKYIRFDVGSDIVYEKNMSVIRVSSVFFIFIVLGCPQHDYNIKP